MSRTYRNYVQVRRRSPLEVLVDGWEPGSEICYWSSYFGIVKSWKKVDPKSPQGRKLLAKAKSDKTWRCKEPGPSWFRNLYTERPYRRRAKRELQKYMCNTEYEPMILSKEPIPYYT